ncbi:MAG: type II secretion system F family protein [Bacteriovoracaceae bacterium]|nr:type II secretion system F family protein [Bacteriovoracaceae bacterium]
MEMRLKFLIWALCWSVVSHVFAQNCAEDFGALDEACIKSKAAALSDKAIPLSKDIVDNVYFYETNQGHFGKLQIISVVTDKERKTGNKECVAYLTASTFIKGRNFQPNSILSIKSEFNVWTQDSLGLDRNGSFDLRLERDGEKCVIKPVASKIALHKKISNSANLFGEVGSRTLYYAGLFLIGLAVFLVAKATLEEENKFKAAEALEEAEADKKQQTTDFVLKYSRPFFKRYFTPIVMGMKGRQNLKTKYRRKLANAGLTKELTPEDFFAFKLFLIIGFPVIFIILRILMEETWNMNIAPLLGLIGFFYPNIWMNSRISARKEDMIRGMPFIVDMLALSVEAGLDFMAAIQKVIEKAPPSPLVEEFETMIKETKIGSSRAEGLRQLAWRIDVLPINSFCATLIAADSVGASIGPILKQLSNEMRQKRSSEAEKKGATAATKILFPMIMFIMPAVFIAIAGPMLLRFITGGN